MRPVKPFLAGILRAVAYADNPPVVRYGAVRFTLWDVPDVGWLLFDDGTIGNAASGATFHDPLAQNLFLLMFLKFSDALCPIKTNAGAATTRAAQTDGPTAWAAGCRIALPISLGHAIGVAGSGAGLTPRTAGSVVGEEKHLQLLTELVGHHHGVPLSATSSTGSDPAPLVPTGGNGGASENTADTGGGLPFNVMQPTLWLHAEVKL